MKIKSKYIIIVLSICSLLLGMKVIEYHNLKKDLQDSIDNSFKYQLNQVLNSFSMIVNDYTYRSMISSLSAATATSGLTTYQKINYDLELSLHQLYISLREDQSKNKVLEHTDELRELFFILFQDPVNREATDKIFRIAEESLGIIKN